MKLSPAEIRRIESLGAKIGQPARIPPVRNAVSFAPSNRQQSLWLARWNPPSLNTMLGHWAKAARIKKADRERIGAEFMLQGLTKATGRRRVDLLVILAPGKRRIDKDNARKSVNDALKHCGAILGDSPNLLAEGFVSFARAEVLAGEEPVWGTVILLTDME